MSLTPLILSLPGGYAIGPLPFVLAGVVLLLFGAVLWTVVVVWTAWVTYRPPRMRGGRAWARLGRTSPDDLGLSYEEEPYDLRDAADPTATLRLAAWWLPHPDGGARTCVLLHGYGDARAGALAWAGVWRRLGFHLLLFDARAHGDSGGRFSSGGVHERDDLHRLLDALKQRRPVESKRLVLFGVSFGCLAAAACAAGRDDVAALVLDSPILDWPTAARRHARLLGLPLDLAHGLRVRLAERYLRVRFDDVRLTRTLPDVRCPVLAVLPRRDVLLAADEADAIAAACDASWRPDSFHNLAIADDPDLYERTLRDFLKGGRGSPPAPPAAGVRPAPA